MKDNLKLILKHVMRFFLRIFWLFPIKKKTIFFMANMGKNYLCNPKYLYQSIVQDEAFNDYQFVWCFVAPQNQDMSQFPERTRLIKKGNLFSYFYNLLTAGIIVYNCGGFSYAPIRKKQFLIETWHGGGAFKRSGLTVPGKSNSSKKGISMASKEIKLFLSSSAIATKYVINQSLDYHGEVLQSGFPRNDILFHPDPEKVSAVKKHLGIECDKHIVLYAPTFKGEESHAQNLDERYEVISPEMVKQELHKRFGEDWVFLCRGHQYTNEIAIPDSDGDVSSYADMQELLMASDVLITDYSSSVWDFAILERPAFLFAPDLEQYENKERGFLIPIEKIPAILVQSNHELKEKIARFSEEEYSHILSEFKMFAGSYETGSACEITKKRILSR